MAAQRSAIVKHQQRSLFSKQQKTEFLSNWYGGGKSVGLRKRKRPFHRHKSMHLVMKSSKALGNWNFLRQKNRSILGQILKKQSEKHQIQVIRFSNVGNHLHLVIKASSREGLKNFLKSFAAMLARAITGARKGRPLVGGKFWDHVAFTRILGSKKEFVGGLRYLWLNDVEAQFGAVARSFAADWLKSG